MRRLASLLVVLQCSAPAFGNAATVELLTLAGVSGLRTPAQNASDSIRSDSLLISSSDVVGSSYNGDPEDTGPNTVLPYSGAASYDASIDARRGELKFYVNASINSGPCSNLNCDVAVSSSAQLFVQQDITVSGSGTITALIDVDALWARGIPNYYFIASAQVFAGSSGNDVDEINLDYLSTPDTNSVDQLLTASINVDNEVNGPIRLRWRLEGGVASSDGVSTPSSKFSAFMDASNTGTFFFETSGDLTVTSVSEGFLSDPAFLQQPSPVPLSSSFPFLALALAGLVSTKRRRFKSSLTSETSIL